MYLPPDSKYIDDAISEIPKNCKDKDEAMNKEIRDVPHVDAFEIAKEIESGSTIGIGKERYEGVSLGKAAGI